MRNLRKAFGYGVSKIFPGIIGLVTVPFWLRYFGEESYASYTSIWVVANFSGSIVVGWLRQGILRYAGNSRYTLATVPLAIVILCAIGGSVPTVVATLLIAEKGDANLLFITFGVAYSALNSVYLVVQAQAQRDGEVTRYATSEIARAAVALIVSLALSAIAGIAGESAMVGGYAAATALALIILRVRRATGTAVRRSRNVAKVLWLYGWPMSIWLAFSQVLTYFDRLVLAPNVSAAELGQYAATSDLIVRGVAMIGYPVTMMAHPLVMVRWNTGDHVGALRVNRRYLWITGGLTLACVAALALVGRPVLELLLGIDDPDLVVTLALAIGSGLWQVALQAHKPLEMSGRTKQMTGMLIAVCAVTIGSLVVFSPIFGVRGAAVTYATGAGLYVAGSVFASRSVK